MPVSSSYADDNGFWHYKRDAAHEWVVAHNRAVLMKYNAHINVEIAASTLSLYYMRKYISKLPPDVAARLHMCTSLSDQYNLFEKMRTTSAGEAIWILLGFDESFNEPAVTILPVHLRNKNSVVFDTAHVTILST
jgi:hypothetical protein